MAHNSNPQIERIPFYIEMGRDVLLSWCHLPQVPTDHVVIICPPVGHEFINSYRGLRHLADGFAGAGITAFRIEYQGVGDSSGLDTDPDRIEKWLSSIESLIKFIKENCGVKHVSLFGLRMGGTLATLLSEKLDLHALLCWVPVVEGRRYIREMLALQRTGENADLDVDSSSLEGGGFLITRETMNNMLSLSLLKISSARAGHLFLFYSDDMPTPNDLIVHWSSQNPGFYHASLPGYADMMALPHHNKVPFEAIQNITEKFMEIVSFPVKVDRENFVNLKKYQHSRFDCYTYGLSAKESMDAGGGFPVYEKICQFSNPPLFAIMSQPLLRDSEHKPAILLLNAGSVHRIGPNRNYIYLTRQLLSQGYSVMRMDFLGLGDSIREDVLRENDPYTPEILQNIEAAIAVLKEKFGVDQIILMGICSGAYASYQAALHVEDMAIQEFVAINPLTFYWREGMSLEATTLGHHWNWNRYAINIWKMDSWLKLIKGKINVKDIFVTVFSRLFIKARAFFAILFNGIKSSVGAQLFEDLAHDLTKIHKKGIKIRFFFAESDPGYQILMESAGHVVRRLSMDKDVEITFIPKANHNFSSHLGRSRLLGQIIRYFSSRDEGS